MSNVFHKIHENIRMGEGCVVVETEESQDVIEEIRGGVYATNKAAEEPNPRAIGVAFAAESSTSSPSSFSNPKRSGPNPIS